MAVKRSIKVIPNKSPWFLFITFILTCLEAVPQINYRTLLYIKTIEAVPQINYRTLLYIKTMTVKQHKSEIYDTPRVNTKEFLKNCYVRCKISY
jgi:hypothetical protein